MDNKPFAEVIESNLQEFTAQCWKWDHFPPFGSLITIQADQTTLFGVVFQVKTGSIDPIRYPFAYQKTEKELLEEQPQIFEFLKTSFSCLIIGHQVQNRPLSYSLAPKPAKIHAFTALASIQQAKLFFSNRNYLHPLFALHSATFNLDELLIRLLQQQSELKMLNKAAIIDFTNTFNLLIGNDYRRLKLFLQRAEHLITP